MTEFGFLSTNPFGDIGELVSVHVGAGMFISAAQMALDKRDWLGAIKSCDDAIKANNDQNAHRLKAVALSHLGRHEEAIKSIASAIGLDSESAENHSVCGMVYFHAGDAKAAALSFEAALILNPDFAEAAVNLSALYLMEHRFAEAWPLYLARFSTVNAPPSPAAKQIDQFDAPLVSQDTGVPIWDGKPYPGKTLLVWGEQGLGDQILYSSMLRDLQKLRMTVCYVCERRLLPLFSRSFPWLVVVSASSAAMPKYDYQILGGELGLYLRPSVESFAGRTGWLKASPAKTSDFRKRMTSYAGRPLIGLSWHSARPDDGTEKSLPIETVQDLVGKVKFDSRLRWLNLQYGSERDKMAGLERDLSINSGADMDGLAAQLSGVSLLVTVSNVTAHLAAALGVETWLLEPRGKGSRWYWGTPEKPSPWYPGVRVFHQTVPGDWGSVVERVRAALVERFDGR